MCQFWSAYAPCSSQHLDAVQLTLEQIDLIRRLVNLYPQHMALVTTADGKTTLIFCLNLYPLTRVCVCQFQASKTVIAKERSPV